jgi:hypothetical protein
LTEVSSRQLQVREIGKVGFQLLEMPGKGLDGRLLTTGNRPPKEGLTHPSTLPALSSETGGCQFHSIAERNPLLQPEGNETRVFPTRKSMATLWQTKERSEFATAMAGQGFIPQGGVLPAFENAAKNSELVALISDDPAKLVKLASRDSVAADRRRRLSCPKSLFKIKRRLVRWKSVAIL